MNKILEIVQNLNLAFQLVGKDVEFIVSLINQHKSAIDALTARVAALEEGASSSNPN